MLASVSLLVNPAKEAGIEVPSDLDDFDPKEFPHFTIFCNWQIGRPMPSPGCHWENAEIIAKLSKEECLSVTYCQLLEKGAV